MIASTEMEPFVSSLQHVLAELERIDLLIRAQISQARQIQQTDEEFQGLYISEEEVEALLAEPVGMPGWATVPGPAAGPQVVVALERLATDIARRRAESARRGVTLRLEELARRFQLTAFELDALLICVAPEVDLRYERLFAYLQDDVTKKRPSVDLVLNLLCPSFAAKLEARAHFRGRATLVRHRLVELFEDPSRPQPPLVARYLKADDRVVDYLFDGDPLDRRLLPYTRLIVPSARFDDLVQPPEIKRPLQALARAPGIASAGRVLYFQGPYGVGRETTAEALCCEHGLKLLEVDLGPLSAADDDFAAVLDLAGREAALQGAAVYWRSFDLLLADDERLRYSTFLRRLEETRGLSFLAGNIPWEPSDGLAGVEFLRLEFPLPDHRQRIELWSRALAGQPTAEPPDLAALATRFRFSGGQIRDAAATARSLARRRAPENGHITMDELSAACRLQSNQKLATLAQKITPHYRWSDIVLPRDRLDQLGEICNSVKYRARVWEEWGFERKLALGKGTKVLFSGPSGTGKTMSAEIIAGELGIDLYKIDLSTVVSKYIGETEKNLARIFAEAERSNAVLLFDEADALFGKRSEVRDSHDRYANIEVSYLLQRMDEYEGVVILATNLRKNLDDAFVRRLHFTVEFPLPDTRDRLRIWQGIWPRETPRRPELDLELIARRFEITGGTIRNIALAAAFLAAADGGVVGMDHLLRATRREFQKMGKVVAEGQFTRPPAGTMP